MYMAQSGNLISGDGILTSLKMMEVMLAKKLPMSKLAEPLKILSAGAGERPCD